MIGLYELVSLRRDVERYGLKKGDIGMVIDIYENGKGYLVEFGDAQGNTIGVLALNSHDIQRLNSTQILHVRELDENTKARPNCSRHAP